LSRGYRNSIRWDASKPQEAWGAPRRRFEQATPFISQIGQGPRGRTQELEPLAIEIYARDLSMRDIE